MMRVFFLINLIAVPLCAFDFNPLTLWKKYQAQQAYANQEYDNAKTLMQSRIVDAPQDVESLYNVGKAFYAQKDWQHAEQYFDAALKKAKQGSELEKRALFDKANSVTHQDKLEEALELYKKVVELDPDHKESQKMIQQIEDELKKRKEQPPQNDKKDSQEKNKNQKDKQDKENKSDQKSDEKKDQKDQDQDGSQDSDQNKGNNDSKDKDGSESEQKDSQNKAGDQKGDDNVKKDNEGNKKPDQQEKNKDEGAGENPDNEKQENPQDRSGDHQEQNQEQQSNEQHQKTPAGTEQSSGEQHNQEQEKQQGAQPIEETKEQPDDRLSDDENKFLKLLDEFDAQALKKMIKTEIKQGMPTQHGQKNW